MCRPFRPAICAASVTSNSESTTIPICCTNAQQTLLRRVHCQQQRQHQLLHRHAHRDRILFLLLSLDCGSLLHGGSFAPWGSSSGRPDSQASEEPPLLHEFNKLWDIPPGSLVPRVSRRLQRMHPAKLAADGSRERNPIASKRRGRVSLRAKPIAELNAKPSPASHRFPRMQKARVFRSSQRGRRRSRTPV